jgi:membrane-associated phospholipid phosphatase
MYRGEHHPTDILGSLLFSALWLTATTLLINPNADGQVRSREAAHAAAGTFGAAASRRPEPEPSQENAERAPANHRL